MVDTTDLSVDDASGHDGAPSVLLRSELAAVPLTEQINQTRLLREDIDRVLGLLTPEGRTREATMTTIIGDLGGVGTGLMAMQDVRCHVDHDPCREGLRWARSALTDALMSLAPYVGQHTAPANPDAVAYAVRRLGGARTHTDRVLAHLRQAAEKARRDAAVTRDGAPAERKAAGGSFALTSRPNTGNSWGTADGR